MPKNEEEFDPSKPLDDEEDEQEVQRKVKAKKRFDFLMEGNTTKKKKKGTLDI